MPVLPIIALVVSCVVCLISMYVAWKKKGVTKSPT